MTPTRDRTLVKNTPINKAPSAHHEKVEENIKVENEENIGKKEMVPAETTCFPPIDQC